VRAINKGLAKALRRGSEAAICQRWGVTAQTVRKWRQALSVGGLTEGSRRLPSEHTAGETGEQRRRRARRKDNDPQRRARIAAAKRGKPRPAHVIEALRAANVGKTLSEETRRKLSEAHRRRGTLVPGTNVWTPEEDELARPLPAAEVAARTGRTVGAVQKHRRKLRARGGEQLE
jgi:transposase-like protein